MDTPHGTYRLAGFLISLDVYIPVVTVIFTRKFSVPHVLCAVGCRKRPLALLSRSPQQGSQIALQVGHLAHWFYVIY